MILNNAFVDDGSDWQLEFEDDFNGTSVDLSKWTPSYAALETNNAYRLPENVSVSSDVFKGKNTSATGVCKIILKKETITKQTTPWDPNSPVSTYNYTSGDLWSKQNYGWGKYEIRCKIAKGNNFWSAFCMYGQKNGIGNEIDIFEFSNGLDLLGNVNKDKLCKFVEMHYHLWDKTQSIAGVDHDCGNSTGGIHGIDYSEDFHIFTMIWDRWGISWFIDGKLIKMVAQWYDLEGKALTKENIKPTQIVLRNDWFPALPMSIGFGFNIKSKPDSDDPNSLPAEYLIDYIRYYKRY